MITKGFAMLLSSVTFVLSKAVLGELLIEFDHLAVPHGLGNNGSHRDGHGSAISFDNCPVGVLQSFHRLSIHQDQRRWFFRILK